MIRLCVGLLFFLATIAMADELRPGYLSISEQSALEYHVVLKLPMKGERILDLYPQYPSDCGAGLLHSFQDGRAATQYWQLNCQQSLQGRKIAIPNLSVSSTDVYVRYQSTQGEFHYRLTPVNTWQTLAGYQGEGQANVWSTYTLLGIEHILVGWDHLCFVLLLMFVMRSHRQLLLAVTGFTLAHSVTLVASTLGWVNIPVISVEILIAASIVFVAREVLKAEEGSGLTMQYPLAITGVFGLFHGFGFATVLQDIGLPKQSIPEALLSFNIGVEIGQLLFIAAIWMIQTAIFKFVPPRLFVKSASCIVGITASYWVIARAETLLVGF